MSLYYILQYDEYAGEQSQIADIMENFCDELYKDKS